MNGWLRLKKLPLRPLSRKSDIRLLPKNDHLFGSTSSAYWASSFLPPSPLSWATFSSRAIISHSANELRNGYCTSCRNPFALWCHLSLPRKPMPNHPCGRLDIWETNSQIYYVASKTLCSIKFYVGRQYGKVAYLELSSHQISEPNKRLSVRNYISQKFQRLSLINQRRRRILYV